MSEQSQFVLLMYFVGFPFKQHDDSVTQSLMIVCMETSQSQPGYHRICSLPASKILPVLLATGNQLENVSGIQQVAVANGFVQVSYIVMVMYASTG